MRANNLTRRQLLGTAAGAALSSQIPDAAARPLFARGGRAIGSAPPPSEGMSLTYVNTAGSTSPSDVPIQAPMWFCRGDVPSGMIAVPQIAGVDQVYQADNRVYWGDGSLRGAVFRIAKAAAISAGGTTQITFDVRSGSYSNTSEVTVSTITGETDIKIEVSNCHTANPGYIESAQYAVTVGGGQITGVKLYYAHNSGVSGTANINQLGGGSGGQVTFTAGVPSVSAAGSGYVLLGGTGAFSVAMNTILDAIDTNGNRTGGRRLEWYAKGPVCDAIRVSVAGNGLPVHFHATFYVERWKKADGSLLGYRRYVILGTGLISVGTDIVNYTYDLDFKDGTTIICGASGGDARFETMPHYVAAGCITLDTLGQPYWSVNGTAFNAILQQRTPQECSYLRATGMIFPWSKTLVPTTSPPTTPGYSEFAAAAGRTKLLTYQPFADGGIRAPLGNPGGGGQISPMTELDGLWWMSLYNGQTANARTWQRNSRIGAAHGLSLGQQGSALFEPTTMFVPNCVATSAQTFSGMTPTRDLIFAHPSYIPFSATYGSTHPLIWPNGNFQDSNSQTYHQICLTYGIYLIEGEQWQADAQMYSFTNCLFGRGPVKKIATLGAESFYGIMSSTDTNARDQAWWQRHGVYTSAIRPTVWADGSTDIESVYVRYCTQRHYEYLNALRAFAGTVKFGNPSDPTTYSKPYSYLNTGVWPEAGQPGQAEFSVPFMESYDFEVACHAAWIHQGTGIGDAAAIDRDQQALCRIGMYATGNSLAQGLMPTGFRIMHLKNPPPNQPCDMTVGFDPVNPEYGSIPYTFTGEGNEHDGYISVTSGSSTVTINAGGILMVGSTAMPNGSRIKFTTTRPALMDPNYCTIPSGFDNTTWYYWLQGANPGVGQLCTGLDGNGDPDPTTAVVAGATSSPHYFVVVFKDGPTISMPNWAPNEAYGRLAQFSGDAILFKAFGGPSMGGKRDAALSNFNTIRANTSGFINNVRADPMYAWDDSLT